jgi:hypothetical protein
MSKLVVVLGSVVLVCAIAGYAIAAPMSYGSAGGTSQFSNRNLYVTVFHPTS